MVFSARLCTSSSVLPFCFAPPFLEKSSCWNTRVLPLLNSSFSWWIFILQCRLRYQKWLSKLCEVINPWQLMFVLCVILRTWNCMVLAMYIWCHWYQSLLYAISWFKRAGMWWLEKHCYNWVTKFFWEHFRRWQVAQWSQVHQWYLWTVPPRERKIIGLVISIRIRDEIFKRVWLRVIQGICYSGVNYYELFE